MGTGTAFRKAGPATEKALKRDFFFLYGEQKHIIDFAEFRYFDHFGQTSYANWFSFRVRKVIVHILK